MPDYTDPWLIPYPRADEYGAGATDLEEMARAIDPLLVAQDARITANAAKPTLLVRRSADVAYNPGDAIAFNTVDHNNASVVITNDGFQDVYTTPQPGAHVLGGVYPAIWRMDYNVYFVATTPTAGDRYRGSVNIRQYSPLSGLLATLYTPEVTEAESTGIGALAGHWLNLSFCVYLVSPGAFRPALSTAVVGTFKANSFFSLTRIRSVR